MPRTDASQPSTGVRWASSDAQSPSPLGESGYELDSYFSNDPLFRLPVFMDAVVLQFRWLCPRCPFK